MKLRVLPMLLLVLLPSASASACRSLLDLEVQYRDCLPPTRSPYVEHFDGSKQDLVDQCWQLEGDGRDGAVVSVEDGDLVVNSGAAEWTLERMGPMVYRRLEGNFVVAVRAEALDRFSADHCRPDDKFAGLVSRRGDSEWATLLVSPFFQSPDVDCDDESGTQPNARAEVRSRGWGAASPPAADFSIDDIGQDGEADIALCRDGDKLRYYYYDRAQADPAVAWKGVPAGQALAGHTVGFGALDVGLTVGGRDPNYDVQGHFAWVVFQEEVGINDGCAGVLARLEPPGDD